MCSGQSYLLSITRKALLRENSDINENADFRESFIQMIGWIAEGSIRVS